MSADFAIGAVATENVDASATPRKRANAVRSAAQRKCSPLDAMSSFFIKTELFSIESTVGFNPRVVGRSTHFSFDMRAGNGNRTRMASLEGWNFTIKLCPRAFKLARSLTKAKRIFFYSLRFRLRAYYLRQFVRHLLFVCLAVSNPL
jgi:hypothetical protein